MAAMPTAYPPGLTVCACPVNPMGSVSHPADGREGQGRPGRVMRPPPRSHALKTDPNSRTAQVRAPGKGVRVQILLAHWLGAICEHCHRAPSMSLTLFPTI
jgi:hypothetical protein